MRRWPLRCFAIAELFSLADDVGCCVSCHEDEDLGYHIIEVYDDWELMAVICCDINNALPEGWEDKLKAHWRALPQACDLSKEG